MLASFRSLRNHFQQWIHVDTERCNDCSNRTFPKTRLFVLPIKKTLSETDSLQLRTPTSGRSVDFDDAATWPYIDDDIPV
ncbi:unnamed protein product [Bursaphelenchus okinawaensis]|uniref:Uncharacterized protein n=1 Tax=Bursaphelenchus okinawaensis TaxID=465554 RepID=A0A811KSW1_9BILA|nr:unnamed protein product [Bursaphelenchus okinawaensis]CAG9112738.1 unnamed protein product [Bursaphelenchus okinawaensis]